jgi:hypothetical protein
MLVCRGAIRRRFRGAGAGSRRGAVAATLPGTMQAAWASTLHAVDFRGNFRGTSAGTPFSSHAHLIPRFTSLPHQQISNQAF